MKLTLERLAELFLSPSVIRAEINEGGARYFCCEMSNIPADLKSREVEALDLGCDCIVVYLSEDLED